MRALELEIGRWYRHLGKGELFQVTGIDENSGTIEIQFFGGDLDEIEADGSDELALAPAEPPEDWTGAIDDVEADDLGNTDVEPTSTNWTQPPVPLGVEAFDDTRGDLGGDLNRLVGDEEG